MIMEDLNQYLSDRNRVIEEVSKASTKPFEPKKCFCGANLSNIKQVFSMSDGIYFKCKKCGQVQTDIWIGQAIKNLDALGEKYGVIADQDPIYHYQYLILYTRGFVYNDPTIAKSAHFAKRLNEPYSSADENLSKEYEKIRTDKMASDEKSKRIKKSRKRKILITLLSIGSVIAFCGGSFLALHFGAPELIYPSNTLTYIIDGEEFQKKVSYNEKYTLDVPKKTGYKFLGYFDGEDDSANLIVDADGKCVNRYKEKGGTTVYARFELITYNVKLDSNGGYLEGSKLSQEIPYKNELSSFEISKIERTGYDFLGWFNKENSGIKVLTDDGHPLETCKILNESTYVLPENSNVVNIYAIWQGREYEVQFDINGGDSIEKMNQNVVYGSKTSLIIPVRYGYDFAGWYIDDTQITDSNGVMLNSWEIDHTQVLTAHWTEGSFKIFFKNVSGQNFVNIKFNEKITLPDLIGRKYDTDPIIKIDGLDYHPGDEYTMIHGENIEVEVVWNSNGWNYISNASELANLASTGLDKKYCLLSDIDISGYKNWEPLGGSNLEVMFTGIFDGNNHNISGFTRTSNIPEVNSRSYFGLFGGIGSGAVVKDLSIKNVSVKVTGPANNNGGMRAFMGIVAGKCSGTLDNVSTDGSFVYSCCTNGETWMGGLVGYSYYAQIVNCTNKATVTGDRYTLCAGGFVGYSEGGKIEGCTNNANVTAVGTDWGGIARASLIGGTCHNSNRTVLSNNTLYGSVSAKGYDNWACKCATSTTDFASYYNSTY